MDGGLRETHRGIAGFLFCFVSRREERVDIAAVHGRAAQPGPARPDVLPELRAAGPKEMINTVWHATISSLWLRCRAARRRRCLSHGGGGNTQGRGSAERAAFGIEAALDCKRSLAINQVAAASAAALAPAALAPAPAAAPAKPPPPAAAPAAGGAAAATRCIDNKTPRTRQGRQLAQAFGCRLTRLVVQARQGKVLS